MRVSEMMSPRPLAVDAGTSLDEVARRMDAERLRHLLVTDGGELLGLVSDRDLLGVIGWRGASDGRSLRDVVRRDLVTIRPDVEVVAAAVELLCYRVGCLPVVDGDRVVGVVTESGVLTVYERACRGGGVRDDPAVERLMSSEVTAVEPDTMIEDAAALCSREGIRHLPVVEHGGLAGIVSDRDLRAAGGRGEPGETPVRTLMSTDVVSVAPLDPASRAAQLTIAQRISALPVLAGQRLAGIVTTTDLLEHAARALARG